MLFSNYLGKTKSSKNHSKYFMHNFKNFSRSIHTAWEVSKYGVFSDPYFPVFGLNTEIYSVNLRIQSKYRKIRTRKNSIFEHFSHSASLRKLLPNLRFPANLRLQKKLKFCQFKQEIGRKGVTHQLFGTVPRF